MKRFYILGIALLVLIAGTGLAAWRVPRVARALHLTANVSQPAPAEDPYAAFLAEVREKIKKNYWEKITDEQLDELFRLGTEKLQKQGVADKKEFTTQLANIVLVNLKPFGRSGLLTEKQQQALINTVTNVDPTKDLYAALDLPKTASRGAVEAAYQAKPKTEARTHAFQVLTNDQSKQRYDKTGAEPTVSSHLLSPTVAYIKLDKFSPQTFDEFIAIANSITDLPAQVGKPGLDSLILDLRDNVGGSIDLLQYFLGPFIGPNEYAYEFFHQGDLTPYKTKAGWLESLKKYKKVVILVNDKTQSSAEVMALTLKKYHVGIVIGTTTKGWGTIEHLSSIDHQIDSQQKYSIVLVESVTLREDGKPIESRGVDPTIKITDKDWPKQLMAYFNYSPLVDAVKKVWNNQVQ